MVDKRPPFAVRNLHFCVTTISFTQLIGSLCDVIDTILRGKSMLIEPKEQCFYTERYQK